MADFVSTGELPSPELVQQLVDDAHRRFHLNGEGANSRVYPELTRVPSDLFGLCVVGSYGRIYTAGDADAEFALMSVAKPFVFALVCDAVGPDALREKVGVNATGLPFNSLAAVEQSADGRTNPMVNPGAIATTSLVPGATSGEKWRFLLEGLSGCAGRELSLDEAVFESASATNVRNRELAGLLESRDRIYWDAAEAVELYTKQSCLSVTARDVAAMGATLANGGVNPITGVRVIGERSCHYALVVMTTAGLYETSGDWLYDIGLPGKSGIGGGIVAVAPGKGGLGVFAPRLDAAGNSVKGQLAAAYLSRSLGLDLFASNPVA
jgi:glutaminase